MARPAPAASAQQLFNRGLKSFNNGNFKRCLKLFRRADFRARDPELRAQVQLYIGLTFAMTQRKQAARAAFKRALIFDPFLKIDAERFGPAISAEFESVRSALRGELLITADRNGAAVFLDGQPVGTTPLSVRVPIGRHSVEVITGTMQLRKEVVIRVEATTRLSFALPLPPKPPPPLKRRGATLRILGLIAAAGAVGAGSVGLALWISAGNDADEHQSLVDENKAETNKDVKSRNEQAIAELDDTIYQKDLAANIVGYGVGGLLAATAVTLFLVDWAMDDEAPTDSDVSLTPGVGSVSLRLRF